MEIELSRPVDTILVLSHVRLMHEIGEKLFFTSDTIKEDR